MRCLTVLFFCLFIESSFATKCHLNDKPGTNLVLYAYKKQAKSFPVPTIEYGDKAVLKFSKKYAQDITEYGKTLLDLLDRQIEEEGKKLIDAIQEDVRKLERSIKLIAKSNSQDSSLNEVFKMLIKQFDSFLKLKPGKTIERPEVSYPVQPTEIISKTKKCPLTELFLNLAETFDKDLSCVYGYITGVYIDGWSVPKRYANIAAAEERNKILNTPVLDAYREAAEKVFKQSAFIRKHVEPKIWNTFKKAGDEIIKISQEYNATKDKNHCQ